METVFCTMLLTQKCKNKSVPKVLVIHIYIYDAKIFLLLLAQEREFLIAELFKTGI